MQERTGLNVIEEEYSSEVVGIPELPQGVLDRLSRVMTLWHTDPYKASWYIDPKLAERLWGKSRSKKAAVPTFSDKVEAKIQELWLTDPERAVKFVRPTHAIKRYGRPPGITPQKLIELNRLYEMLNGKATSTERDSSDDRNCK